MTTGKNKDALIAELDRVAGETLAYFDGPGRRTDARVDRWQARDIMMHFIYFHDATAWGIAAAAQGGPPWPVPADADTVNEVCRRGTFRPPRRNRRRDSTAAAVVPATAPVSRADESPIDPLEDLRVAVQGLDDREPDGMDLLERVRERFQHGRLASDRVCAELLELTKSAI